MNHEKNGYAKNGKMTKLSVEFVNTICLLQTTISFNVLKYDSLLRSMLQSRYPRISRWGICGTKQQLYLPKAFWYHSSRSSERIPHQMPGDITGKRSRIPISQLPAAHLDQQKRWPAFCLTFFPRLCTRCVRVSVCAPPPTARHTYA